MRMSIFIRITTIYPTRLIATMCLRARAFDNHIQGNNRVLSVGCWSAFAVSQANGRIVLVIIVGLLAGLASMFGVAYLYKLSFKMQEDGTLNINNAIGQVGKVYLTVPLRRRLGRSC